MKIKLTFALVGMLAIGFLTGCNMGMQPTGSTVEEINAIRAKWPPEKQIEGIQQSPMPAAEKVRRIAEIRQKFHLKDESSSSGQDVPAPNPAGIKIR
jgi:hypothetical protein